MTLLESLTPTDGIEILSPATRDAWLALRSQTIGASEVAAILGCHPWETPLSLWAKKTGATPPEDETPAMKRGRFMERVALELLSEERPQWTIRANPMPGGEFYRNLAHGVSCTPDAFLGTPDKGCGVAQVKSVQKLVFDRKWRNDEGEIEPPLYVAVQAIQEAALTGVDFAVVVALVVDFGIDLHVIDVPIHAGVLKRIGQETARFWELIQRAEQPAPDFARDGALITNLFADDDGSEIDLPVDDALLSKLELREHYLAVEKAGRAADEARSTIDAELRWRLKNAVRGRLPDGRIIEAKTTRVKGRTQIVEPYSFRAVKVKEPKS